MTKYEIIATIIAIIALAQPWLIAVYNRFFIRLNLSFIPSGKIKLYYNRSGAYFSLGGVVEAKNKAAVVKDISAKVIRLNDHAELRTGWSSFTSPVYQNIGDNVVTTNETAHPFRVEANGLTPVFVEFANLNDKIMRRLSEIHNDLSIMAKQIGNNSTSSEQAKAIYRNKPEYQHYEKELREEFFWKPCDYILELTIQYEKAFKVYRYKFSFDETEIAGMKENIEKAMDSHIVQLYGASAIFYYPQKDFQEFKEKR